MGSSKTWPGKPIKTHQALSFTSENTTQPRGPMLDRGSLHSNLPEGPNQRTGSSTSATLSAHPILFTHLSPSRPKSREEKSGPTLECFALIPPFYKTKLPKTNKKTLGSILVRNGRWQIDVAEDVNAEKQMLKSTLDVKHVWVYSLNHLLSGLCV